MGHAELIHKIESLPRVQRAAVIQLVDALVTERRQHDRAELDEAIVAARGSWPRKMSIEEIDADVAAMRNEWDEQL